MKTLMSEVTEYLQHVTQVCSCFCQLEATGRPNPVDYPSDLPPSSLSIRLELIATITSLILHRTIRRNPSPNSHTSNLRPRLLLPYNVRLRQQTLSHLLARVDATWSDFRVSIGSEIGFESSTSKDHARTDSASKPSSDDSRSGSTCCANYGSGCKNKTGGFEGEAFGGVFYEDWLIVVVEDGAVGSHIFDLLVVMVERSDGSV